MNDNTGCCDTCKDKETCTLRKADDNPYENDYACEHCRNQLKENEVRL